jgi:lipoprotein-releasing system ATP-binding protein
MTTTMPLPSLDAADLCKEYPTPGEPLAVLRGVSLHVGVGKSIVVVGCSGSGKSTLLNILGTLDHPTRGSIRLNHRDPFSLSVRDLARFRAEHIGFVFQDHHLLPQCSAVENVLIARLAAGRVSLDDRARGEDLLRQVGLGERLTHLPSQLSGGERQRVAIARALMNRPSLLLCDEPTGNLDGKTAQSIGQLLATVVGDGRTMLVVVTHNLSLAELFPRRMRMDEGRLVEE